MASAAAYMFRSSRTAVSVRRDAGQNVLLVTIDTWRSDGLSSAGGVAQTPQMDRLAADGIRFDFVHAHAVVTLPSHASILTGLYPYAHGVRDNAGFRLAPAIPTLASRLKGQGYSTGAFVGAYPVAAQFGLNQGFEVYDDRFGEMGGPWDLQTAERPAAEVVRAARAWIAARPSKWFAWVHVFDPHAPYRPPPPFDAQYAQAPYAGEVAYTDSALGPLFDDVRRQPRRTLVIVTGDHGEALGEHGEATHGLFAYESTLRVPLIVTQLDRSSSRAATTAPTVRHEPVRHIDLVPTVLDAVRVPAASDLPGQSLVPLIDGSEPPRSDARARAASYFEAMSATFNRGWAPLRGVLVGRDKYIDLPIPELYDLSRDAFEQDNAVARTADRARELERLLRELHADAASPRGDVDPETAKRLAALGYVSGAADRKSRYGEADDPKRLLPLDQALHRGVALVAEGRIREAIAEYERVIADRPDMAVAASHLAYLHWKEGRTTAAIRTLQTAWNAGGRTDAVRAQLGIYLAQTGSARDAIALLSPVSEQPRPDVDVLNALGIAYATAGDADRGLAAFQRVLEIDPANHMAIENIATIHLRRGNLTEARKGFERALELDAASAAAHAGLGAVELKADRGDQAIPHLRRAIELDPENFDALYNLGTELVRAGQVDAARPVLEQFVRTAPPSLYAADIQRLRGMLRGLRSNARH